MKKKNEKYVLWKYINEVNLAKYITKVLSYNLHVGQ